MKTRTLKFRTDILTTQVVSKDQLRRLKGGQDATKTETDVIIEEIIDV